MPIRHFTIDPPFNRESNDTFIRNGDRYEQWRGNTLVDYRLLSQQNNKLLDEPYHFGTNQITELLLEENMPGVVATLTSVTVEEGTGKYFYRFSDGTELEYPDRDGALSAVQELDTDPEIPRKFLILSSLRRDNNGANAAVMVGRCCSVDCAAQQPLSLSLGVELS